MNKPSYLCSNELSIIIILCIHYHYMEERSKYIECIMHIYLLTIWVDILPLYIMASIKVQCWLYHNTGLDLGTYIIYKLIIRLFVIFNMSYQIKFIKKFKYLFKMHCIGRVNFMIVSIIKDLIFEDHIMVSIREMLIISYVFDAWYSWHHDNPGYLKIYQPMIG